MSANSIYCITDFPFKQWIAWKVSFHSLQLHYDFLEIIDAIPVITSIAETEKAPLIMRTKGLLVPPESAYLERGAFYHLCDVSSSFVNTGNFVLLKF